MGNVLADIPRTEGGALDFPAFSYTWFNVSAWSGKDGMEKEGMADFYGIQRGVLSF